MVPWFSLPLSLSLSLSLRESLSLSLCAVGGSEGDVPAGGTPTLSSSDFQALTQAV
jgi:hypothetical protein